MSIGYTITIRLGNCFKFYGSHIAYQVQNFLTTGLKFDLVNPEVHGTPGAKIIKHNEGVDIHVREQEFPNTISYW